MPNQGMKSENKHNMGLVLFLTYLMFLMFAMTTDAVGVIIPKIIEEFKLSMAQAGAFHYSTMSGIALSGLFLGSLADKLGRKWSIVVGLIAYAVACLAFAIVNHFVFFLILLFISGAAIGVFKTAAIALIGDLTNSSQQHRNTAFSPENICFIYHYLLLNLLVVYHYPTCVSIVYHYFYAKK